MKFTTEELIRNIIESELTEEEKISMLNNIMTKGRINDGFYLKQDNEGNLECWYRNEDEYGTTDHGPTNYTAEQVVNAAVHNKGKSR